MIPPKIGPSGPEAIEPPGQAEKSVPADMSAKSLPHTLPPHAALKPEAFDPGAIEIALKQLMELAHEIEALFPLAENPSISVRHAEALIRGEEVGDLMNEVADDLASMAVQFGAEPLEKSIGPLMDIQKVANEIALKIVAGETAFELPRTFGKGATLMVKRAALNQVWKEVATLHDPVKVAKLKAWLDVQERELAEDANAFAVQTVSYTPGAIKVALAVGGKLTPVAGLSIFGATMAVQAGVKGYELYTAATASHEHAAWVQKLKGNPLSSQELKTLLERRKALAPPQDLAQLRNSVRALALVKQENERKFFTFKLTTSALSFSVATLAATVLITLKVLAFAGIIALSATALAYTGVGLVALAVGLMAAGLLFLYFYKPHVFKTFFNGVQLRLAFYTLPKMIQEFQVERKKVQQMEAALAVESLSSHLIEVEGIEDLSAHTRKLIEKWKQKEAKIGQELASIDAVRRSWKEKTEALQKKVLIAYWHDLQPAFGAKIDLRAITEGLVDGLLFNPGRLDPETQSVLATQLGIDGNALSRQPGREVLKQEVEKALLEFFALDDKALIHFIREQEAKIKQGVAQL